MPLTEKSWSREMEKPIYEEWKRLKAHAFDQKSKKKLYSIDTPPPYVNTPIHIGHATTYTIMDFFARFKRMTGHNVLFPLGLDRNGLPIEMAAEKKFNVSLKDTSREEFIKLCQEILEESSLASMESFLRLGISFNSWDVGSGIGDVYLTDSNEYRALTQATFIEMYNKGLVYEDERINNFCPGCGTTIADAEIDYAEVNSSWNEVKFRVKETNEAIIIGTTRPELIASDRAVIFNPEDKRYKHLSGKTALTPIYEREIPIIAHPMADMEKGTGLVMMSTAGDLADVRFCREMGLTAVISINENGRMNENAGFLKGLKVKEARHAMIEELKKRQLLVKQTPTVHRTPICERSKHNIEFIGQKEFYLKQLEFKAETRKIADKINFYSPRSRQILLDWIDGISIDWPISRRRYYATEIPLWYCKSCGTAVVAEKGKYYQPWKEKPPVKSCSCGSTEYRGEERVFDTWFDSSISPLYILGYPTDFFMKHKVCTLRPQGKEIVRNWLYYTLLRCYQLTGKEIFKDVWIHYHVVDENGKKMSKSIGNVIDPKDVLDRYGAEPFRFWCAIEGNLAETDFRCSFERIEGASKTLTKLWNVAKFVSQFTPLPKAAALTETDKWIMQEVNDLMKHTMENYEKYDFHLPATKVKHFIWETFASHYIELVKTRAYNHGNKFTKEEQNSAIFTLNYCLDSILKLLAPIIPMMTYKIYKDLRKKDIQSEKFPEPEKGLRLQFTTAELIELNSMIWKAKKDKGLSLKAEIKELVIPDKFKGIENDLVVTHNVKSIKYGKGIGITL